MWPEATSTVAWGHTHRWPDATRDGTSGHTKEKGKYKTMTERRRKRLCCFAAAPPEPRRSNDLPSFSTADRRIKDRRPADLPSHLLPKKKILPAGSSTAGSRLHDQTRETDQ